MNFPLLSRRNDPDAPADAGTAAPAAGRAPARNGTTTTDTVEQTVDLAEEDRRRQRADGGRTAGQQRSDLDHPDLSRPPSGGEADRRDRGPVLAADRRDDRPVVAGRKARASLLATVGLLVGVAGLLFVLTGTLAGYGIGVGAVGAVLAVLGLVATRRRHVAGKPDALVGMVAGLAAVVLGVLAMSGQYDWPTTDGDWVNRFREWLDSQFVDRL